MRSIRGASILVQQGSDSPLTKHFHGFVCLASVEVRRSSIGLDFFREIGESGPVELNVEEVSSWTDPLGKELLRLAF